MNQPTTRILIQCRRCQEVTTLTPPGGRLDVGDLAEMSRHATKHVNEPKVRRAFAIRRVPA